ncbi:MAG: T9SS type A sorting domain-containing protein [Bacteroidota bacterium]|nr:T9SS type A sorting domain-containing protein [Bacteroidota bacterium]
MRKLLLIALLLSGMMTSAQTSITDGNCKAAFKYAVNDKLMSPVPATAINFYDTSEGKVTFWFWNFGEGNTSTEQNPMFVFTHPLESPNFKINPYRTVSLTVLTSDTCKSFYSLTINIMDGTTFVQPSCTAGFKYYQTAYDSIAGTASFQLTNLSKGESLKYSWQFDDGKISTEKEPIVTFDLSRPDRKVCLTVTGPDNCTDTYCDAVYLINPDQPVDPADPKPADCETIFGYSVNYDIKTFAPALVLDFYSKAWPEPTGWHWDFGDGNTSNEANPTHIFNFPIVKDSISGDPNSFRKVCLTVKTAAGCVATWCETIDIYMKTTPPDEPSPFCQAMFKYYKPRDVMSVPEVIPYQLIDASEGKVVSRFWQFEDGKTSTEAEPLVSFDFQKPTQKVCLTIETADGCSSTWCDVINITGKKTDTTYVTIPVNIYTMRYESSFPIYMSSCAGWAKAQVYMNDSLVEAGKYVWSTGAEGQEVKGLCPTQMYTVKGVTPDGTYVSGTFVFNSDGTVTEAPYNWWVTGTRDNPFILFDLDNRDLTVEWRLCDGTIVKNDSVALNLINCGTSESNMILKDAAGNVVYSEIISLKTMATAVKPNHAAASVKLYPNPVKDVLNIYYSGSRLNEMQLEICDVAGRTISTQKFFDVGSGQQISLNVNSLRQGIYFCKMFSGKQLIRIEKFSK